MRKRAESGLMLIEVLVAMGILSLITMLIYGSISRSLEARELAERIENRYANARVSMSRMAREISMAYLSVHVSQDKRTQTLFKGKSESPIDRLLFSSMAHMRLARNSHESDLAYVTYFGETSKDYSGRYNLMRREKPMRPSLDDKPEDEKGGVADVLAEDVVGLDLTYWDDQQREWLDEWDTTGVEKGNRLPRLVKITLTVLDEAGKEMTFTTKTRVFMDKPLAF
ncbi:MAG: hypothetical protein HY897_09310 [Deltaproteobacteria bacterium]|nr:hypothetical protein [Deltaproteobacteria bacterium]